MTPFTPIVDGVTPVNAAAVNQRLYELASLYSQAVMGVISQGRLSLTTLVPVTTSDVTAATTLRFVPYIGNKVLLYNGSSWDIHTFSELSLSLSGFTANKNYDIFLANISGTLTLEAVVWTNDTTRATALTRQNGILVKSGDATRLYLGTIRTTNTTGQCEDSLTKRFVWNYYQRVARRLEKSVIASHTYTTASYRAWNNDATNSVDLVTGVNEDAVQIGVLSQMSATAAINAFVGIGVNSTTSSLLNPANLTGIGARQSALQNVSLSAGLNNICVLEFSSGSTSTFAMYQLDMRIRG